MNIEQEIKGRLEALENDVKALIEPMQKHWDAIDTFHRVMKGVNTPVVEKKKINNGENKTHNLNKPYRFLRVNNQLGTTQLNLYSSEGAPFPFLQVPAGKIMAFEYPEAIDSFYTSGGQGYIEASNYPLYGFST